MRRARRRRATRGVNGNSCSLPLMPLRLTRPSQEKKWGSGKLSRAHGAELPVAVVRRRGCAGDEHQIGDLAVDPVPLAVEERAPRALAVLHRAPATGMDLRHSLNLLMSRGWTEISRALPPFGKQSLMESIRA